LLSSASRSVLAPAWTRRQITVAFAGCSGACVLAELSFGAKR
jgi:hypothetical protein